MGATITGAQRITKTTPLMVQRDLAFEPFGSVACAVEEPTFEFPPDEPAMLVSSRGNVCAFNLTGALLWEGLDTASEPRDLAELLIRTFDVDAPSAERAVRDFLARLVNLGLATVTGQVGTAGQKITLR